MVPDCPGRALHDEPLRETLAESFRTARADVVRMLDLGDGRIADDAGTVLLATFDGLLIRSLLHPEFGLDAPRMTEAAKRLTLAASHEAGGPELGRL